MSKMLKHISQTFTSIHLRQLAFWMVVWGLFVYFDNNTYPSILTLLLELSNTALLALVINFNIQVLIPRFLNERQYFKYFMSVMGTAMVITPIKLTISYLLKTNYGIPTTGLIQSAPIHTISYIIITIGATFFQIITDWALLLQERKALSRKTTQAELQALKNQLNPHFLFNTLNNLYALTLKKSDHAPEVVLKLSEMMRYMLYEGNKGVVPLEKEVQYIRNYLDLERIKQTEHFKINMQVTGDPSGHLIPPMLFLPFIENSIKHGLNRTIDRGFIDILLSIESTSIFFRISNSTAPITEPDKDGGIGIANIKNRLALLYPGAHQLSMKHTGDTYDVELSIDLTQQTKAIEI